MRIGNFKFSPRWQPTLLVILLLPVLLGLGVWQLIRTDQKKAIIAAEDASLAKSPLIIANKFEATENLQFRRLQITGQFDTTHLIYIDNKVQQGQVGYDVVMPLRIHGTQQFVLVNRGWVPLGASRAEFPAIATPDTEITIVGIAKYDPKDVVAMGKGNRSNEGWPALVRWIDISQLQQELKVELVPFLLLLDPSSPYGFVREWKFVSMPPEKHMSYAVQWFALAMALFIIYIVVNTRRINKNGTKDEY